MDSGLARQQDCIDIPVVCRSRRNGESPLQRSAALMEMENQKTVVVETKKEEGKLRSMPTAVSRRLNSPK